MAKVKQGLFIAIIVIVSSLHSAEFAECLLFDCHRYNR